MTEKNAAIKKPAGFDWQAIYKRLEANQRRMEGDMFQVGEIKQKILHERAIVLAEEPKKEESCLEVLEFLLAYEKYGIETTYVKEVYPLTDITPLPGTPSFVMGIIAVRGEILSVIDLKFFFDLPSKGLTDLNKVIILSDERMEFGILADAIVGIHKIALTKIQPALPTLTGIRAEYLRGVTVERLAILDAQKILSDEKIIVNKGVSK